MVQTAKVDTLTPHPENAAIYGGELEAEFITSIKENGIIAPLVVAHDNRIISGHRRYLAAKQLGITEVPVVVFKSQDELDILQALVHSNRQRAKTNWQIAREAETLIEIESRRAAQRMKDAGKVGGKVGGRGNLKDEKKGKPSGADPFKGTQARDEVAKTLGIGHSTVERAAKTIGIVRKLEEEGNTEQVEEIKTIMNEKGFSPALRAAEEAIQEKEQSEFPSCGEDLADCESAARRLIGQLEKAHSKAKDLRVLIQAIYNSDDGVVLRKQIQLKDMDLIVRSLGSSIPVAVGCPNCDGKDSDCAFCYGTNMLAKRNYKNAVEQFEGEKKRRIHLIK